MTVTWLEAQADGSFATLANRRIALREGTEIAVAASPTRFVRFARFGASPVTVASADLLTGSPWNLPKAVVGGELLVHLLDAPIAPEPSDWMVR